MCPGLKMDQMGQKSGIAEATADIRSREETKNLAGDGSHFSLICHVVSRGPSKIRHAGAGGSNPAGFVGALKWPEEKTRQPRIKKLYTVTSGSQTEEQKGMQIFSQKRKKTWGESGEKFGPLVYLLKKGSQLFKGLSIF